MSGPLRPHDGIEDLRKRVRVVQEGLLKTCYSSIPLPPSFFPLFVSGRGLPLVDDGGWNTVPISKGSRPIDTSRLTKITKVGLYSGVGEVEGGERCAMR